MHETHERTGVALWKVPLIAGIVAVVAAAAVATKATGDAKGAFADEANYGPALLLLGVGAFLVLLAVILNGQRRG